MWDSNYTYIETYFTLSPADYTVSVMTSSSELENHFLLIVVSATVTTGALVIIGALIAATIVFAQLCLCKKQPTEQGQLMHHPYGVWMHHLYRVWMHC